MSEFTSFCFYGVEISLSRSAALFWVLICVFAQFIFIYLFAGNVWGGIFKSWQRCGGFILGLISSILIQTTEKKTFNNIFNNCLLGGEGGGAFLDPGGHPDCSPYYFTSSQWLSPCTPTLPCKNSFSSSAGKTPCPFTLDYCVHLLHRQQVCFPLPYCKGDEIVQT